MSEQGGLIGLAEAKRAAEAVVGGFAKKWKVPLVILDKHTQETPQGWVFVYNARAFAETGDYRQSLRGPGPLFITKRGGYVFNFGSAPFEHNQLVLLQKELEEKGENGLSDRMRNRYLGNSTDLLATPQQPSPTSPPESKS